MHRIAVLVFNGIHSFDLAMPLQVFSTAHSLEKGPGELFGPRLYDLRVCGDGCDLIMAGVDAVEMYRFTPPYPLADALLADTIVVLGAPKGLDEPEEAITLLHEAHRRGIRIASICSGGARVLAASGLLDGRRVATHWSRADVLADLYPLVEVDSDVLFIDHGDVLMSAGAASGIDMCLHMIRQDFGSAVAADVARHMVMPPQRDGGQAPYIAHPEPGAGHGSLESTMEWMNERLVEPLTLAAIASHAGMSERSVSRKFKEQTGTSPLQWLVRQRIHHAQDLLETTDMSIEDIASHCGFGTSVAMRQHFAKHVKISPMAYRRAFRAHPDSP
jgi:transcriptional regulator GlxA family with amidase domain